MTKYPKWKVGLTVQNFYTVEVDASCEKAAIETAIHEIEKDPSYHLTGVSKGVTGIFINDREARDFHPYVPDGVSQRN